MGGSPPRPWAHPTRGLEPLPTGPMHWPPGLPRCTLVWGVRGSPPQPLVPSPHFAHAPSGEAVGPGVGPSPSAKNSGAQAGWKPPWRRRKERGHRAGAWPRGVRLGRKCPGALAPAAKVPLMAQPPGKSQAVPGTRMGQESPRSLGLGLASRRGGSPISQLVATAWAWPSWPPGSPDGASSSSSVISAPGDELNSPPPIPPSLSQQAPFTEGLLVGDRAEHSTVHGCPRVLAEHK